MKISEQIISRGLYNYNLPNYPIEVVQYVFIRQRGKKCLLLRFRNNSEFTINKFEYEIIQLNKKGEEIFRTTLKTPPMNEVSQSVFTLSDGIIVDEKCFDFRINYITLRTGDYEYIFTENDFIVSFVQENRTVTPPLFETIGNKKRTATSISKKQYSFKFALILAIITSLIILNIVLFSYMGEKIL